MPLLNSPLQKHRVLNRWYRFRLLRGHAAGILPQWVNCHPTDRSRICMDIIWQYLSKANSSNVHDFLLIIGTVLNLVKKMYSSTCSSSILCLVVCVQLYPGRSEASCQIPALDFRATITDKNDHTTFTAIYVLNLVGSTCILHILLTSILNLVVSSDTTNTKINISTVPRYTPY